MTAGCGRGGNICYRGRSCGASQNPGVCVEGVMRNSLLPFLLGNIILSAAQQLRKSPKRMVAAACMKYWVFLLEILGVSPPTQSSCVSTAGLEEHGFCALHPHCAPSCPPPIPNLAVSFEVTARSALLNSQPALKIYDFTKGN